MDSHSLEVDFVSDLGLQASHAHPRSSHSTV